MTQKTKKMSNKMKHRYWNKFIKLMNISFKKTYVSDYDYWNIIEDTRQDFKENPHSIKYGIKMLDDWIKEQDELSEYE